MRIPWMKTTGDSCRTRCLRPWKKPGVPMEDGTWEIGYHIAKAYTGNGYATEAVKAFLPEMAGRVGISEVYGICLKENIASVHVLKKCGFEPVFEGIGDYQGEKREIFRSVRKI